MPAVQGQDARLIKRAQPRVNSWFIPSKKSLQHLVGGAATARFTMMEKLEHQYGADALSEALEVSESGFATHRGKQNGERWKQDAELQS